MDFLKTNLFVLIICFPLVVSPNKTNPIKREHKITFQEDGIKITITDTEERIGEIDIIAKDVYEYDNNYKLKVIQDLKYYEILKRKASKESQRVQ